MRTLLSVSIAALLMTLPAHAAIVTEAVITDIGSVTATVKFKTDVPTRGYLIYIPLGQTLNPNGTYPGLGTALSTSTSSGSTYTTQHAVMLGGLFADTDYTIRIQAPTAVPGVLAVKIIDKAFHTRTKTDKTPPIISAVTVVPSQTYARVSFRTNEQVGSVGVTYALPGAVLPRCNMNTFYNILYIPAIHNTSANRLLPDTVYNYRACANDLEMNQGMSPQATFRTIK